MPRLPLNNSVKKTQEKVGGEDDKSEKITAPKRHSAMCRECEKNCSRPKSSCPAKATVKVCGLACALRNSIRTLF